MENIQTLITKDGKVYKVSVQLLKKYSHFFRIFLQEGPKQDLKLQQVQSEAFDYIYQFLQLHKNQQPKPIKKPLQVNLNLSSILSFQDFELISRIKMLDDDKKKLIIDATYFFGIQSMKMMLIYGLFQDYLKNSSIKMYKLDQKKEQNLRINIQTKINNLILMKNQIQSE